MKNKKWWIIGGLIVAGAGVGAYFLFRPSKEEREKKKLAKGDDSNDEENSNSLGETPPKDNVNEQQVSTPAYNSRPREVYPETPFKNTTEGNAFRQWVNDNHTDYAKSIKLDPTGKYNNAFIRKAYQKYGTEYSKALSDQEKKDAGIVTVEMTKAFQDSMAKWNKPSSLTTKGKPYFKLYFRPLYKADNCHKVYVSGTYGSYGSTQYEQKGDCKGTLTIYTTFDNPKTPEGKVAWVCSWRGSIIAKGTASPDLRTITTSYNVNKSRATMGFVNKATVGNSFGQIIGWDGNNCNMRLAWC